MALLKYFKPINRSTLPLPIGLFSEIVPSSSIKAANKEVEFTVSQVEKSSSENDPEGNSATAESKVRWLNNEEQIEEIFCGTWPTTTPSNLQTATANKSCGLLINFYNAHTLKLFSDYSRPRTSVFMVTVNHGDKLVRIVIGHSLVGQFGIMLSSKIYSQKVSQRPIIENLVPQNYLAIRVV